MHLPDLWRGVFRIVVGIFWLYFASQKWGGVGWMQPLIQDAAAFNPIPGLHELLAVVVAFETNDLGLRWLYYLAVLINAELIFVEAGWPALGAYRFVPAWLRS